MARLTCAYCNNVIKRSDRKCPYCGAETETSFKRFMEERETETESNKEVLKTLNNSRSKLVIALVLATIALVTLSALLFKHVESTLKIIVFVVLVLTYVVCLIMVIKGIRKSNTERDKLNDRIDGLSHNIIFDCEEVQPYKMINDIEGMANDGCHKEGLQQMAFKVSITNGVRHRVEFDLTNEFFSKNPRFGYHVYLNADSIRMEDCKLVPFFDHHEENNKVFEPPLYSQGFQNVSLRPQESIVGWVAFYVTPEAEDLELIFADDYVPVTNPLRAN